MHVMVIKLLLMAVLLLGWLLGVTIYFGQKRKQYFDAQNFLVHVRCEKCQTDYEVSIGEYIRKKFSRKRTLQVGDNIGSAGAEVEHSFHMEKRFVCPSCQKVRWGEIMNLNAIRKNYGSWTVKSMFLQLVVMTSGGIVLLGMIQIFLFHR